MSQIFFKLNPIIVFRDYDLSLVCKSKCDDECLQCATHCGSSECLLECNRVWATCGDGKYPWSLRLEPLFILACPCYIDCINGCDGCENPICFCNVGWSYQM